MTEHAERIKRGAVGYSAYTLLIMAFILFCTHNKLEADWSTQSWQSLITRLVLITLAASIASWRIIVPLPVTSPQSRRRFILCLIFLGVLFYPFFSHFSYFSKSIKEVAHSITSGQESFYGKTVALLKKFPSTYNQHTDEHFELPKMFIHLDALVKVYGLGVSPNNNVAVGKDGFYFEGWGARKVEKGIIENFDNIADYMGQIPFSPEDLRQWKRTLEERSYWLREQGIDYVFVLAPTKAFVYPEYLPTSLQKVSKGITRYEQLSAYLRQYADIHFIDLLPSLLLAKEKRDYPLLFYKTDFHWNYYGAFIVYKTIIEGLQRFLPQYELRQPEFNDFELKVDEHWAHHRFMDMVGLPVMLHRNEHYITMVPQEGGAYDSALDIPPEGIHDVYPPERRIVNEKGESMNIRLILNPDAPVGSLLLLGDSFLEKCVYYFSADAQRVLNFRTVVNFPDQIFRFEKPDIVIQEILNMFILRRPPINPSGFTGSYLRGKFKDSVHNILWRADAQDVMKTVQGTTVIHEIDAPSLNRMLNGEVRVARISMINPGQGQVKIRILGNNSRELVKYEKVLTPDKEDIYIEFPQEDVAGITLSISNEENSSTAFKSIELRSDLSNEPEV